MVSSGLSSFSRTGANPAGALRCWALVGLLTLQAGCTVRSLEELETDAAVNQCDSSSSCSGGACVDGRCLAESGEIERVLLEIVPPVGTSSRDGQSDGGMSAISSVRYLLERELPERGSDFLSREERAAFGLELPPMARVTGAVDFANLMREPEGACLRDAEAVTVQARFTPSEQLLGVPGVTYTADVTRAGSELSSPVELKLNVPPGHYDIFLQTSVSSEGCSVTPRLFRRRPIGIVQQDDTDASHVDEVRIPLLLTTPSRLALEIQWPQGEGGLDGWRIAMVDSRSGLLLSTQQVLNPPIDSGLEYSVLVEYSPVDYSSGMAPEVPAETEVLRLSPPEGVVAPTLYAARVGLELFVPNEAVLALKDLPEVVSVVGQVLLSGTETMGCAADPIASADENPCAVPFSVQIHSAAGASGTSTFMDTIPQGMIASFQQTVETNADLSFQVDLPVGEYRAIAIPTSDERRPWAIGEGSWVVGDQDREVHGKTVNVRPRASVTGSVHTRASGPASGFSVQMNASPRELVSGELGETVLRANTVLELTRRETILPRASGSFLSQDGSFEVLADSGVFDLSVRPDVTSGYAWLVAPNVPVGATGAQANSDLGTLRMPQPVRYTGGVSSLSFGGSVANALIRAYVYLDAEGELTGDVIEATSVLQVAETRADAAGEFELLLPSEIHTD